MGRTGDEHGREEMLAALLPPALEVMTAWSLAEDGQPREFTDAMNRVVGDIATAADPQREMSRFLFALTSLSGILLDRLADRYDTDRRQVLQAVRERYVDPGHAGEPPAA